MNFYTFVQQTCLENIIRVSYKSQTTGVLGQHSLSLVCGSRRDLKKVAWSLDRLGCGSAHVSWVPMGRLTFKPLPWSRSSPDVWDVSATITPWELCHPTGPGELLFTGRELDGMKQDRTVSEVCRQRS